MAEPGAPAQIRKPANDAPPAMDTGSGTATVPAAGGGPGPAPPAAGTGSVGTRQLQAKAAGTPTIGAAEDPAERAADETADRVMRMMDPVGAPPEKDVRDAPPAADPGRNPTVPAPVPAADVRRKEAAAERMPAAGAEAAAPEAGRGAPGAGPRPDIVTPAGPAPLVAAPAGAAAGPGGKAGAESGMPAPEPEPPAAPGEQPARGTPEIPQDVQDYLEASRGRGAPLPEDTRKEFEAKFGRTLDDVGIHDTAQADNAARRIDALAFTRGSDIYFRSGAFDPTSETGRHLLAHELAHVVQQRPGVNRELRRAPAKGKGKVTASPEPTTKGTRKDFEIPKDLDAKDAAGAGSKKGKKPVAPPAGKLTEDGNLILDVLYVPRFKLSDQAPLPLRWNRAKRTGKEAENWRTAAGPEIAKQLQSGPAEGKTPPLSFQFGPDSKARFYLGTDTEIGLALSSLPYDRGVPPKAHDYDIDHKWEHQLGGGDEADNLRLLDRSANRAAGPAIMKSIERDVAEFLRLANPQLATPREPSTVNVSFTDKQEGPNPRQAQASDIWKRSLTDVDSWEINHVKDPKSVAGLKAIESDKAKARAFGSKEKLAIYTKVGGGAVQNPAWDPQTGKIRGIYGRGFRVVEATHKTAEPPAKGHPPGTPVGHIQVNFFEKADGGKLAPSVLSPVKHPFDITAMPGVLYGGLVNTELLRAKSKQPESSPFHATSASPIAFPELDFDLSAGLVGRGTIPKPTVKLLENVDFAVVLDGDNVGLEGTIIGSALKLPGPFKVSGGTIMLRATTGGISAEGRILFEIERLATGHLEVAASTTKGGTGFALDGKLNFDSKTFDPATVGVSYRDGKWSGRGELGVGPGKIKGIKSASAKVAVDEDKISAEGEFVTSIKGVKQGKIGMRYDPVTGTQISGMIEFGDLPGIKSGKLDATITQGKEGWTLAGGVTMVSSIPGIAATVTGRYADGAFDVNATLAYARGIAKGTVTLGLTNAAVDAGGRPAGPPRPDGALTAYGEGMVTLKLTEWLQGTVGLKLKPNGEIEVAGEVALPSTFEVFGEQRVDRKILSIGIDIPILGISAAGQRIGIFATVRGGVTVGAGVGPGVLKNVSAKVTYNPDLPEATTVKGQGTFYVPASAGLRLTIDGALGVGIPVVSATAGLTVFGEVGLMAAASATAALEWSAPKGVTLDAKGEIVVQPKFRFGIEAFVDVSLDLWVKTIELYHKKWTLASFEYGPGLTFGMMFPIHYESGRPFELSYDQIQWKYPDINPSELLGGLVKQVVG